MNINQINLFREMVEHYEQDIQWWNKSVEIEKVGYDKVRYAKETLNDLENRIPTERQLELQSNIIDFKYNIKKREHILYHQDFYQTDGCSEINGICDYRHLIEEAEKELKDNAVKKVFS